jgi:hypothetical protein
VTVVIVVVTVVDESVCVKLDSVTDVDVAVVVNDVCVFVVDDSVIVVLDIEPDVDVFVSDVEVTVPDVVE